MKMGSSEDDIARIVLDDGPLVSDQSPTMKKDKKEPPMKRHKALLICVVCGDDAHGIIYVFITNKISAFFSSY